jgi:hypothetical protein
MQITVNNAIAKRMDDSNSTTSRRRSEWERRETPWVETVMREEEKIQKKGAPVIYRARPAQSRRPVQSSLSERSAWIVPTNINVCLYPWRDKVNRLRPCPRHQRKPAM